MRILAAETPNPILPLWQEIVIGLLAFAVVFFVLAKYVFPRMEETFKARVDYVSAAIDPSTRVIAALAYARSDQPAKTLQLTAEVQPLPPNIELLRDVARAEAFLRRQNKTIAILAFALACLIYILYAFVRAHNEHDPASTSMLALWTTLSFILGAACSVE